MTGLSSLEFSTLKEWESEAFSFDEFGHERGKTDAQSSPGQEQVKGFVREETRPLKKLKLGKKTNFPCFYTLSCHIFLKYFEYFSFLIILITLESGWFSFLKIFFGLALLVLLFKKESVFPS